MFRVIGCLTQEHDFLLVGAAALVCVVGSLITVRLLSRLRRSRGRRRETALVLTGVMGGATIWTTHFVAMIAYDPGVSDGYDPLVTAGSLFIAVAGVTASFALAVLRTGPLAFELGGAAFGLSVAAMHYVGMSGFLVPGRIGWDAGYVAASVALGAALGALALNRVARPLTRHCWLGGVVSMTLAICAMHFTGMAAASIDLDPTIAAPQKTMSDATLGTLVLSVMLLFLLVGLAAFRIDVDSEAETAIRLDHASRHDPLTGIANRSRLLQELDALDGRAAAGEEVRAAVLTLDLARFKEVNDAHGHETGDAALKAVATALEAALRPGEFVGRTGGDEFVAIRVDCAGAADALAFAERLQGAANAPVAAGSVRLRLVASVGVATFPENGADFGEVLRNADLATSRAKEGSAGRIVVFEEKLAAEIRARVEFINDLRDAVESGAFELRYQRQNDVRTRRTVGFEALVRWPHPTRGMVSPGEFIPIAEHTGLIRPLGAWVLRAACREAATWRPALKVAVNVAPQQLDEPDFVETVSDVLLETGLDPTRLELEITEASVIGDPRNTLDVIRRLKALGIRIAMDDFGTGYSSLASLRQFPFDKIKIDRSFVTGARSDAQKAAILRATILLGASLRIPVLAEGAETEDDLSLLREENCGEAQGFLFGRPMTAAEARALLASEAGDEDVRRFDGAA